MAVTAVGAGGEFRRRQGDELARQVVLAPGVLQFVPNLLDANAVRKELASGEVERVYVLTPGKVLNDWPLIEEHAVGITPVECVWRRIRIDAHRIAGALDLAI